MKPQNAKLSQIIKALLISSPEPLSLLQLKNLFAADNIEINSIKEALQTVVDKDEEVFELKQVANGYRLQVKSEYATWIKRLNPEREAKYSRAVLETLAIIAYRQPATRGDIEEIRGVQCSSKMLQMLFEREWIKVVGHRETPGHPELLGTSKKFLDYFNLQSLADLPALNDFAGKFDKKLITHEK